MGDWQQTKMASSLESIARVLEERLPPRPDEDQPTHEELRLMNIHLGEENNFLRGQVKEERDVAAGLILDHDKALHKHDKLVTRLRKWAHSVECACPSPSVSCDRCLILAFLESDANGE